MDGFNERYRGWEIWEWGGKWYANHFGVRLFSNDYAGIKRRIDIEEVEREDFYKRLAEEINLTVHRE